jgi:hypothetical protein
MAHIDLEHRTVGCTTAGAAPGVKTVLKTRMPETEGNEGERVVSGRFPMASNTKQQNNSTKSASFQLATDHQQLATPASLSSFSTVDRFPSLFHSPPARHPLGGAGSVRDLHPTVRCSWRRDRDHPEVVSQLTLILTAIHNTQGMSRLPSENRQVRLVYRCWNFAGKVSFSLTVGDSRRAFQAVVLTRYVVAAARDRA